MENPKYIVTVDLTLPPLRSGAKPYRTFEQFPSLHGAARHPIFISLHRLWTILKLAWHGEVMVLDSTSGPLQPDLLACILIRLFPKKPIIVMTGDMWNKGGALKYKFQKMIIHLADPSILRYVVHSLGEEKDFPRLWNVSPRKVRSCIYHYTFTDEEIAAGSIETKGYIFAGGDPSRDYAALLETARQLPHRRFIIATRKFHKNETTPQNVELVQIPHQEFICLMREADMVITPLVSGQTRSAGQQTYLNAMRMSKVSIVNGKDVYGVTDYIQDHVNGIFSDGTPEGYGKAIEWVYNPANRETVRKIEQSAQETVREFTHESHISTMASIIEEAIAESGNAFSA